MTAAPGQAPAGDKKLSVGPVALLLVSMFFLGVVIWGMFNRPDIRIVIEEVGPLDDFAIGRLVARPEQGLYLIGMDDGRIRALDMRIEETDCIAEWVADDDRGRAVNPGAQPGVFRDPCSTALWSMEGNAIQGTLEPLRTPVVTVKPDTEGRAMRVYVEMINP
ncbi:MAG: hypothetical protein Q7K37_10575 [Dehalococcoidia bacterium]|nr:hypothetical protein [Dehalococcoidia bacterium]